MAARRRRGAAIQAEHEPEAVEGLDALADALLSLRDREECRRFLRDLCTLPELQALAHRWQIARLLDRRLPYLEVARRARASTTTVTRVAHWLRHGSGGYGVALERTRPRKETR